jgi:hypothetical protein
MKLCQWKYLIVDYYCPDENRFITPIKFVNIENKNRVSEQLLLLLLILLLLPLLLLRLTLLVLVIL